MSRNKLDVLFREIIRTTALGAKGFGFKLQGSCLKKICHGNAAIIEFQKSQRNTSASLFFTLNLAVVCGALLDPEMLSLEKAKSYNGHLRDRIGSLTPCHQDLWWEITPGSDSKALALEVANIVCQQAIKYLEQYMDDTDLIALWEAGKSPGLTDGQRLRNLKELKEKIKGGSV